MVAAVLADDSASTELPQTGVMVARHRHQVRRVGREGAVPDPPLVASQGGLEEEGVVDRVHRRTIGLRSECLLRGLLSWRVIRQAQQVTVRVEDAQEVVTPALGISRGGLVLVLRRARLRLPLLLLLPLLEGGLGRRVLGVKVPHLGGVVG